MSLRRLCLVLLSYAMLPKIFLLLVPVLLLLKLIDDCSHSSGEEEDDQLKAAVNQRLLLVSFDGFRYDYMNQKATPNLYRLANQEGVTGHMLSTFTSKTFPNHHSIATGQYQETHGIVNNIMWDPRLGEVFHHKKAEELSNAWWDNGESTPLYIANQLAGSGRASACAPWIGCHARYYGNHSARHYRVYNLSADPWEQVDWALERMTRKEEPANLAMIYIPFPDVISHLKGPFSEETLTKVRQLDTLVDYIRRRLLASRALANSTNLIILSDHGMTEISSCRSIALDSFLNASWYEAYGSNPVLHVRPKAGFEQLVRLALVKKEAQGHYRLYEKRTLPDRYRYRFHRRIMPLILVAEEGWSIYPTQAEANLKRHHRGQHGYDNILPSMRPLFVAVGPAFKRGYTHRTPFLNVDLYPLMLNLLGIPTDAFFHEGNVKRVKGLLT